MENVEFNIEKCVNAFAGAVGNGATMTKEFTNAVNYVIASGDTTVVLRQYQRAKLRGDDKMASLVLTTFERIFDGAKRNNKAGKIVGLKITDATLSNEAVHTLHELSAESVSMRGSKFKAAFVTDEDETKFDIVAFVARTLKSHPDLDKQAFIAAFKKAA